MHLPPEIFNLILLNIGYSELNADWNWKDVYSPFARIYYVTEGKARTHFGNNTYVLEPGYLYLTPPFTLHDDECEGLFSLYYIHFYEKIINRESIFDKYEFPVQVKATSLDSLLIEELHKINPERHLRQIDPKLYDNPPTFSQFMAYTNKMPLHTLIETQSILSLIISRFFAARRNKSSEKDDRITKSLHYIHENIDKNISISDLSELTCVSEDHFIRIFRNEMKQTPIKYINLKKIEKAQLLLLTSDMPIRNIAIDLSLDNTPYFNRLFKKITGKTPVQYRNEYK